MSTEPQLDIFSAQEGIWPQRHFLFGDFVEQVLVSSGGLGYDAHFSTDHR
jgi:hypothetical protein